MWKAVSIKSVEDSKLSILVYINENKTNKQKIPQKKRKQNKTKPQPNHKKPTKQTNAPKTTHKEISRKENHRQKVREVLGYKREGSFLGHQNQTADTELIHIICLINVIH